MYSGCAYMHVTAKVALRCIQHLDEAAAVKSWKKNSGTAASATSFAMHQKLSYVL